MTNAVIAMGSAYKPHLAPYRAVFRPLHYQFNEGAGARRAMRMTAYLELGMPLHGIARFFCIVCARGGESRQWGLVPGFPGPRACQIRGCGQVSALRGGRVCLCLLWLGAVLARGSS